jgi:hypothetical protein
MTIGIGTPRSSSRIERIFNSPQLLS